MSGMRILLTSNASYAPARGGSTRSNLVWLRHLVAGGHQCRVVCASLDEDTQCTAGGIQIHSLKNLTRRRDILESEIREFHPDLVLVSSEDLSHVLLREAARIAPDRIVYLAHTPQFFPFGAESWNADQRSAEIVRTARAVVAIGRSTAAYIEQATGVHPTVVHPPIYGPPPFARLGCFDRGSVLMINPCQVKGIGIFIELARRFPEFPFAALLGWGTSAADRKALQLLKNIQLIESVDDIEEALSQARVLLMPSLWYEGFGLIAMEAMLRAIPVISSDSGGLVEARQGTGFVIPVQRIQRYLPEFDETHMPRPVIPEQNLEPWQEALGSLLHDRALYEAESERCRAGALGFVSRLDASDFEKLLLSLIAKN
jgi:glycosyltransferase involved in cell wall biosynthesis